MKFSIRHIIFEITQECNLSCLYCYNHWRAQEGTIQSFSFKKTHKTLSKLLKHIDFEHITFTGGEPFIAEGFLELVLKCRLSGKNVTVITNGTNGKKESYHFLNKFGVSLFEIPLLSDTPDIHDILTGKKGSFHRVINTIKILKSYKATLCAVIVLTKLNIENITKILELASKLGIQYIMLARFNIGGNGINNIEKCLPSLQQLRSAFQVANRFCQTSSMKITANVCVPVCILDPNEYPHIPISHCSSNPAKKPITIDANGDLRWCNHSPAIIGNIFSESIENIFQSKYVDTWETSQPEYCASCEHWSLCRGGCRAASEQIGKTIETEDPIISYMLDTEKKPLAPISNTSAS